MLSLKVLLQMASFENFSAAIYRPRFIRDLLAILCLLAPLHIAQGQEVFKWTDSQGNVHYSSRPPKGGSSVERLNQNTLSRYNSDRVLKHLGKDPAKVESRDKESFRAIASDENSEVKKVPSVEELEPSVEIIEPDGTPKISRVTNKKEIKLEQGVMDFRVDDLNQVSYCSISVKNLEDQIAKDVSVAFKFADGSLIPAVGPNEIPAKSDRSFFIPGDLLPMKLKSKGDGSENVVSQPVVVIHGYR